MHEPSVPTPPTPPTPPTQPALPPPLSVTSDSPAGAGGDHDKPFAGFRAYQFSTRQLMQLLLQRSDALDARLGLGRWAQDLGAA